MDPLGTDSCRRTVLMELPVPNGSIQHREPKSKIDDTSMIMQGASRTIVAGAHAGDTSMDVSSGSILGSALRRASPILKI
jgi:hypothetical protein